MIGLLHHWRPSPQLGKQTFLITGASSGIGEQIAVEAARKNATLIIVGRHEKRLEDVKHHCQQYTTNDVITYSIDLEDINQVAHMLNDILATHRIDVLINNAGIGRTDWFIEHTYEEIEHLFQVNVLSMMHITQVVADHMIRHGGGHVFHTASVAGKVATPKTAVYSATKAAIIAFSNALRVELSPFQIMVTTINPGPVNTRFFERNGVRKDYLNRVKPFIITSESIAKRVMQSVGYPDREITMPWTLHIGSILYQICPTLGDRLLSRWFNK